MKKMFLLTVICIVIFILTSCSLTKIEQVKQPSDISRMVLVESIRGGDMHIFYDKYTNVMYMFSYKGGFSPIYNADGSLYLYGSPRSVG